MSDLVQRIRLRAGYEIKKFIRKPLRRFVTPFKSKDNAPVIIHCCYHKIGTHWIGRILRDISAEYGLSFKTGFDYRTIKGFEDNQDADIFLDLGSHVKLDQLPNYVGSHMIRDPRDMVVSGYFYHKWTDEHWANFPKAEYRGMSYKEYLNSLDQNAGLLEEIKRVSFWVPHMASWDFNNPRMYEIKYEDIIVDEQPIFHEMFTHYGFSGQAVDRCCHIAEKYSIQRLKKKKKKGDSPKKSGGSHIRSGKTGEWKELFKNEHKKLFKELYPNALVRLGYEIDDNW